MPTEKTLTLYTYDELSESALVPAARKVEGDLFGSIGAGLALDAVRKFG